MQDNTLKNPSYIDYLNNFSREDAKELFSPTQSRLFLIIINLFNEQRWKKNLELSDNYLVEKVGVSINTLKVAKRALRNRQIIDYIPGGNGFANKTLYSLCYPKSSYPDSPHFRCQTASVKNDTLPYIEDNKDKRYINNNNSYERRSQNITPRAGDYTESDFDE